MSLTEQGGVSGGSLAQSCYVFSDQESSSASLSQGGNSSGAVSGSNQSQGYSGSNSGNFSQNDNVSSSASLLEEGSYSNGSFTLSLFSVSASGGENFSGSQSDSGNWSGSYSGSANSSATQSGNSSWSLSMLGNYSNGQWNLTTDILQGSSSGQYNNSVNDQAALQVSGGPSSADKLSVSKTKALSPSYESYGNGR